MSNSEFSIEETVRGLGSVTEEINKLRDVVSKHRDASLGLTSVATTLSELSQQLMQLPSGVKAQFSGVAQLVRDMDASLRPAGALQSSIRELVVSNERLLSEFHAERDLIRSELRSLREESKAAQNSMRELQNQMHEDLRQLSILGKEHAATQTRETDAIKARLAKLTGLARRGFFALLRGKDAPSEPL